MILLVTPTERRNECAAALKEATGEPVEVAENLVRATALLRMECYTAAVFDQHLVESEPHETDTALEHLGTAIPVQVNLAVSGSERLVREVRAAVRRRMHEEATAREAAARALHSELNGTLTTLLLNCELALGMADLAPATTERLTSIHETAQSLRAQLEGSVSITQAFIRKSLTSPAK